MESAIKASAVVKSFGKTNALRGINFTSKRGFNIILGPNGAGKSTFLRCIDGLYKVDGGSVRVLGKDPYKDSETKYRLSLLTDNYALYDFLSVQDNLKFFGRLYGLKDGETLENAKRVLKGLDALEYMQRKVFELSRGTKQKIAFCRSVLNSPDVLLLDEPTAFLDAHSAESLRRMLLEYEKEGKTILFVTQKLDEVTRFNGSISIIKAGKIVEKTTTEGLYNVVLKNTMVNIRLARPIDKAKARRIYGFFEANSERATLLKFIVHDYRDIKRINKALLGLDADVVSIDYIEHLIDDLSS